MTAPSPGAIRRALTATAVALVFGAVLVAVAGPSSASADVPTVAAPVVTSAADAGGPTDVRLDSSLRASDAPNGHRPVALRAAGERGPVRIALVATAAALAALLAALAALGRAHVPGVERLRRFGASPLGARAPPALLPA